MQLVGRNVFLPVFCTFLGTQGSGFEASAAEKTSTLGWLRNKLKLIFNWVKEQCQDYFGDAEELIGNVELAVLMVYMLDLNKHFTFLETIFGISYAYTYKNDQIKEVSYAIEGYLLLVAFIVKAVKTIHRVYQARKKSQTATD